MGRAHHDGQCVTTPGGGARQQAVQGGKRNASESNEPVATPAFFLVPVATPAFFLVPASRNAWLFFVFFLLGHPMQEDYTREPDECSVCGEVTPPATKRSLRRPPKVAPATPLDCNKVGAATRRAEGEREEGVNTRIDGHGFKNIFPDNFFRTSIHTFFS